MEERVKNSSFQFALKVHHQKHRQLTFKCQPNPQALVKANGEQRVGRPGSARRFAHLCSVLCMMSKSEDCLASPDGLFCCLSAGDTFI